MFIEDDELRTLYRDASQEHLDKLEAGLLNLEKQPDDAGFLKELLREAHSLKGDSRMLGVLDAETLTHHIEDLLIEVDNGEQKVTAELCDRIYQGLDAVRKVANEAVTGQPSGVSLFSVVAQLSGSDVAAEATQSDPDSISELSDLAELPDIAELSQLEDSDPPLSELESLTQESLNQESLTQEPYVPAGLDLSMLDPELVTALQGASPPASNGHVESVPSETPEPTTHQEQGEDTGAYQIDTVRVAAPKLDQLMTQAGELAVTKLRITRRLDDITEILNLWEAWSKENILQRTALENLTQHVDPTLLAPLRKAQRYQNRHLDQFGELIRQLRGTAFADTARLETVATSLESGILKLRMLPLSSLFNLFPRLVRDLSRDQNKEIDFIIEGGDTLADKRILEEMKDPLTHLIRNAIDHGIEPLADRLAAHKPAKATLGIKGYQTGSSICIELIDDGRGLDLDKIKNTALQRNLHSEAELERMSPDQIRALIFEPGFSTRTTVTELSGRGVGLDVVRANVDRLKGSIQVSSEPGQGCIFRLTLGASLATTYALIVTIGSTPYAIPVESVETLIRIQPEDVFIVDGHPTVTFQGQPLSLTWLSDLLDLPTPSSEGANYLSCVVLTAGQERLGVLVEALLDQQDIVIKPQSKLLQRVRNISGATILGNGEICMVLNPQDLVQSVQGNRAIPEKLMEAPQTKPKVLLVEDSLPIRTQVLRILVGAGYEVTAAVDGLDGFEKLGVDSFDAVVSDIEMPNLTGLELTSRIRAQDEYEELPIILVSTLAKDEDRQRGADAGANAYISKGDFDQTLLLDTLRRLI